jgi:RecA-family ATPase
VCKLAEKGWNADRIEAHMRQSAARYSHTKAAQYDSEGRLRQEIERSLKNAGIHVHKTEARPILRWDGDPPPPIPPERVKGLLPEVGIGIEHGQFSTGKTYIALDLCLSAALGTTFIGRPIIKPCGSLFLAYERPHSVFPRWYMAKQIKCPGLLKQLPFAMLAQLPPFMDDDALDTLVEIAKDADKRMRGELGVPLGFIVIDTLVVATGGLSDGTAQEVQPIMSRMRQLSNETQTFVLGLDHQGHTPGRSRGSSDKYGTPDISWSIEAEDKKEGTLTVQKYADGVQGDRFNFTLVLEETKYGDGEIRTQRWVRWEDSAGVVPNVEEQVMDVMLEYPGASFEKIRLELGWKHKSEVQRVMQTLAAKKFVTKNGNQYVLTRDGVRVLKNVANERGTVDAENDD